MAQIALITGGSRGIGRAAVEALAKKGINSVFTYNSSPEVANEVVAKVKENGADAVALQLDVSKPATLDSFVDEFKQTLQSKWGVDKFDFLVNNAGIGSGANASTITGDELDTLYTIHLKSVVLLTQKLLPIIKDGGRILNLSSGLTRFHAPNRIAYASIKGAVEVYSHHLAKELGPRRINVNVIAPGATATDFGGGLIKKNPDIYNAIAQTVAFGKPGSAEEIGDVIASFLSPDTRWITGERIECSGGTHL